MVRIAVLGGTGYAGSLIAREAATRGHDVVAYARSVPREPISSVAYRQGAVPEVIDEAVVDVDVVVGALAARAGLASGIVDIYRRIAERSAATGARLIVVGGSSGLRPATGEPRLVDAGEVPAEFAVEARAMTDVLESLLEAPEPLDWLYVSPAVGFGVYAPGESTGTYRVGEEVALFDRNGQSEISGPDFALAIVDEIEHPQHHRTHIGIAY